MAQDPSAEPTFGLQQTGLRSTPQLDEETPFKTMMASFDAAARMIGLDEQHYSVLRKSDREIAVSVPVQMDDGSLRVYDGFRIQHNAGLGPVVGPCRLDSPRLVELRALAAWMSWCGLLGIPFGGPRVASSPRGTSSPAPNSSASPALDRQPHR